VIQLRFGLNFAGGSFEDLVSEAKDKRADDAEKRKRSDDNYFDRVIAFNQEIYAEDSGGRSTTADVAWNNDGVAPPTRQRTGLLLPPAPLSMSTSIEGPPTRTSRHSGVSWDGQRRTWQVWICDPEPAPSQRGSSSIEALSRTAEERTKNLSERRRYLGSFDDEDEAAACFQAEAKRLGEVLKTKRKPYQLPPGASSLALFAWPKKHGQANREQHALFYSNEEAISVAGSNQNSAIVPLSLQEVGTGGLSRRQVADLLGRHVQSVGELEKRALQHIKNALGRNHISGSRADDLLREVLEAEGGIPGFRGFISRDIEDGNASETEPPSSSAKIPSRPSPSASRSLPAAPPLSISKSWVSGSSQATTLDNNAKGGSSTCSENSSDGRSSTYRVSSSSSSSSSSGSRHSSTGVILGTKEGSQPYLLWENNGSKHDPAAAFGGHDNNDNKSNMDATLGEIAKNGDRRIQTNSHPDVVVGVHDAKEMRDKNISPRRSRSNSAESSCYRQSRRESHEKLPPPSEIKKEAAGDHVGDTFLSATPRPPLPWQRLSQLPLSSSPSSVAPSGASRLSSRFVGVQWEPRRKHWVARIQEKGLQRHLGSFSDEETAARRYDQEAAKLGKRLNFPSQASSSQASSSTTPTPVKAKKRRDLKTIRRLDAYQTNMPELLLTSPSIVPDQKPLAKGSSQYTGVYWARKEHKWRAVARIGGGKKKHLGFFEDEIAAAKAYDELAAELGRPTNFS